MNKFFLFLLNCFGSYNLYRRNLAAGYDTPDNHLYSDLTSQLEYVPGKELVMKAVPVQPDSYSIYNGRLNPF